MSINGFEKNICEKRNEKQKQKQNQMKVKPINM